MVSETPSVRILRFFTYTCVFFPGILFAFSINFYARFQEQLYGFRARRDYSQSRAHGVFELHYRIKDECIGNMSVKKTVNVKQ